MAFWAYLLRCADGSFYAGHTDQLEARIGQHIIGRGGDYTARRQPVTLVWSQDFFDRLEAFEAERRIKVWSRAKKLALIAGDWDEISRLAAPRARPSTSSGRTEGGLIAPQDPVRRELFEGHITTATPAL